MSQLQSNSNNYEVQQQTSALTNSKSALILNNQAQQRHDELESSFNKISKP